MKTPRILLAVLALTTVLAAQDGFTALFNGRDLSGWDGDPALWTVRDGVIVGTSSGPGRPERNSFLIWTGGVLRDFEVRVVLRCVGDNNSGVQYRSRRIPGAGPWAIMGYQCDVHPVAVHTAMTYEERGRGIFGYNGMDVVLDPSGQRWLVAERPPLEVDTAQWNEFTIIARGNQLTHRLNGRTTGVFVDHDEKNRALDGLLAIQLHAGNPNVVEVKSVQFRELAPTPPTAFDATALPAGARRIDKPKVVSAQGKTPARKQP